MEQHMITSLQLKQYLFEEYGGFADRRIKRLEKGYSFIVDDRNEEDVGANGQLYSYFCMIFAKVRAGDQVGLTLHGNVPLSPAIHTWIKTTGAAYSESAFGKSLGLQVKVGEQNRLIELAKHVRAVVAPGARYDVASYKYVCPRTAQALERLAGLLNKAWA